MSGLVFLVFGALAFLLVPALLIRIHIPAPRWRLGLGFLSLLGMFSTTVALLAVALVPEVLTVSNISQLWHLCARAFMGIGSNPLGRWSALSAGLLLVAVIGRFLWVLLAGSVRTWSGRVRTSEARWTMPSGARVYVVGVDHPEAYSIGRPVSQIVISRGLLTLLDAEERAAVLLHEEGHIKGGHHVLVLLAKAMTAALAPLPQGRAALQVVEQAIEEAADDYAADRLANPAIVASGISKVALAHLAAPFAVPLGGGDVPARVRRLLDGDPIGIKGETPRRLALGLLGGLLMGAQSVTGLAIVAMGHRVLGMGSVLFCRFRV